MHNGLGLPTPRGSGTSGYVQKNLSYVGHKTYHQQCYERDPTKAKSDALYKQRDKSIIEHEKKREIEIKCLELSDMLEEQGYPIEDVTAKVDEFRKALFERQNEESQIENTTEDDKNTEDAKNKRMKNALGISDDYVEGSAFNFEEKKKIVEAEKAERELKNIKRKEDIENLEKAIRKREKKRLKDKELRKEHEQVKNLAEHVSHKSTLRDSKYEDGHSKLHENSKKSEEYRRIDNYKNRVFSSEKNERKHGDYEIKRTSSCKEMPKNNNRHDYGRDRHKRKRRDSSITSSPSLDDRKRLVNDIRDEKYSNRKRDSSPERNDEKYSRRRHESPQKRNDEKYSKKSSEYPSKRNDEKYSKKSAESPLKMNDEKYLVRRRKSPPKRNDEKYTVRRRESPQERDAEKYSDRKREFTPERNDGEYSNRRRKSSPERNMNNTRYKIRDRERSKDRRCNTPEKSSVSSKPQYTVRRDKVDDSKGVSKKRRLFTSRSRSSSTSSLSPSPYRR